MPFQQYANSMSVLSYSDEYDAHERFLHCTTIPSVLDAIQGGLLSTPLFPLVERLTVMIARPGGWLEDILPYIPSPKLQHLSIKYHARHTPPWWILDLLLHFSERTPSLRRLKLRLHSCLLERDSKLRIDLFANSEKHPSLRILFLDCAFLSPRTFVGIAGFPCLRHLTLRLRETTIPENLSKSLSFHLLAKLDLRVTQAKLATLFLQCVGSAMMPHVTRISISVEEILPFDRDLGDISYQISRLCSPMSFKALEILFKELATEDGPPPLVSENPGYGLHVFQPLLSFSLRVLNLSLQLPLFTPTPSYVAQMASAWMNLISIQVDVGSIIPFNQQLLVSLSNLIPFFQACQSLRQLYIPFRYEISDPLPSRGIHAYGLLDLGLGYMNPDSQNALAVAQWLRIIAPGLPEIALVDIKGDTVVCSIEELAKLGETTIDADL
jgi:hypothetical protein